MDISQYQPDLIYNLSINKFDVIKNLINTNNLPIWEIDLEGDKSYLHLIAEKQIKLYNNTRKAEINIKEYISFLNYILSHLEQNLTHEEFIAYINKQTEKGYTSLHLASYYGNLYFIQILINKGADINIQTKIGCGMMHLAAQSDQTNVIIFLKELYGLNINQRDNENSTPLHWASFMGSINVVNYLCLSGADIDSKDLKKNTPLHMATDSKKIKIFRILLQNGANPKELNINDENVLDLAKTKKNQYQIRKILEKSIKGQNLCDCSAPLKKTSPSNTNKVIFFFIHLIILASNIFMIIPYIIFPLQLLCLLFIFIELVIFIVLLCINPWINKLSKSQKENFFKDNFSVDKLVEGKAIININNYCPICLVKLKTLFRANKERLNSVMF